MAIDYKSPVGKVRLLIADLNEASFLVANEMIEGYLALEGDSVLRGAAAVLDAMATSEVLLGKVIRTQDVQTDGAKVAAELRAQAATLRARAGAEEVAATGNDDFFGFIPFIPDEPAEGEERRL